MAHLSDDFVQLVHRTSSVNKEEWNGIDVEEKGTESRRVSGNGARTILGHLEAERRGSEDRGEKGVDDDITFDRSFGSEVKKCLIAHAANHEKGKEDESGLNPKTSEQCNTIISSYQQESNDFTSQNVHSSPVYRKKVGSLKVPDSNTSFECSPSPSSMKGTNHVEMEHRKPRIIPYQSPAHINFQNRTPNNLALPIQPFSQFSVRTRSQSQLRVPGDLRSFVGNLSPGNVDESIGPAAILSRRMQPKQTQESNFSFTAAKNDELTGISLDSVNPFYPLNSSRQSNITPSPSNFSTRSTPKSLSINISNSRFEIAKNGRLLASPLPSTATADNSDMLNGNPTRRASIRNIEEVPAARNARSDSVLIANSVSVKDPSCAAVSIRSPSFSNTRLSRSVSDSVITESDESVGPEVFVRTPLYKPRSTPLFASRPAILLADHPLSKLDPKFRSQEGVCSIQIHPDTEHCQANVARALASNRRRTSLNDIFKPPSIETLQVPDSRHNSLRIFLSPAPPSLDENQVKERSSSGISNLRVDWDDSKSSSSRFQSPMHIRTPRFLERSTPKFNAHRAPSLISPRSLWIFRMSTLHEGNSGKPEFSPEKSELACQASTPVFLGRKSPAVKVSRPVVLLENRPLQRELLARGVMDELITQNSPDTLRPCGKVDSLKSKMNRLFDATKEFIPRPSPSGCRSFFQPLVSSEELLLRHPNKFQHKIISSAGSSRRPSVSLETL